MTADIQCFVCVSGLGPSEYLQKVLSVDMSDFQGAAPPPDGVDPDLDNPQDVLKTVMCVTQWLTLLFVSVFVALRLYAKTKILSTVTSWDDCE